MTIGALWAILFVIGVVLMAIGAQGVPGPWARIAWILWAVAALLWLVSDYGGSLNTAPGCVIGNCAHARLL